MPATAAWASLPSCWALANSCPAQQQPPLSAGCGCMQPRRGGGGRVQKTSWATTFLGNWWPPLGLLQCLHLRDFESKTCSTLAAFGRCPWEGQGYTALLLLRRPAAGPEKLRGERCRHRLAKDKSHPPRYATPTSSSYIPKWREWGNIKPMQH